MDVPARRASASSAAGRWPGSSKRCARSAKPTTAQPQLFLADREHVPPARRAAGARTPGWAWTPGRWPGPGRYCRSGAGGVLASDLAQAPARVGEQRFQRRVAEAVAQGGAASRRRTPPIAAPGTVALSICSICGRVCSPVAGCRWLAPAGDCRARARTIGSAPPKPGAWVTGLRRKSSAPRSRTSNRRSGSRRRSGTRSGWWQFGPLADQRGQLGAVQAGHVQVHQHRSGRSCSSAPSLAGDTTWACMPAHEHAFGERGLAGVVLDDQPATARPRGAAAGGAAGRGPGALHARQLRRRGIHQRRQYPAGRIRALAIVGVRHRETLPESTNGQPRARGGGRSGGTCLRSHAIHTTPLGGHYRQARWPRQSAPPARH